MNQFIHHPHPARVMGTAATAQKSGQLAADPGRRDRMQHIDELLRELEEVQPTPLLVQMSTGFPSALLCVLALGALVGALAGQQATRPVSKSGSTLESSSMLEPVAIRAPAAALSRKPPPAVLTAQSELPSPQPLLQTVAQRHQLAEDALFAPQAQAGGLQLSAR